MDKNDKYNIINIIFIGAYRVGKTQLLNTYLGLEFDENSLTTIGTYNSIKELIIEGEKYKTKIWDTSGQERYRALNNVYLKKAQICIMVYDITNRRSFEELNYWKEQIDNYVGKECVIGIIGNKSDLLHSEKVEVLEEEALDFAKMNNFFFKLFSAKNPNHHEFDEFVKELVKRYIEILPPEKMRIDSINITRKKKRKNERKSCCVDRMYFPFIERFKGRVFPWYTPMWELRKRNNSDENLLE